MRFLGYLKRRRDIEDGGTKARIREKCGTVRAEEVETEVCNDVRDRSDHWGLRNTAVFDRPCVDVARGWGGGGGTSFYGSKNGTGRGIEHNIRC